MTLKNKSIRSKRNPRELQPGRGEIPDKHDEHGKKKMQYEARMFSNYTYGLYA
jgi:hypothetical protein